MQRFPATSMPPRPRRRLPTGSVPLWRPSPERAAASNLNRFRREMERRFAENLPGYRELHAWSLQQPDRFWRGLWDFLGIVSQRDSDEVVTQPESLLTCRWFPGTRLCFAENLLQGDPASIAFVQQNEAGARRTLTRGELCHQVACMADALRRLGVRRGDCVAGILPNTPEAFAAMLAANAVGAIWTICSPEFGAPALLDRLGPLEPRVVFGVDVTAYKRRRVPALETLKEVCKSLPSCEHVILLRRESADVRFPGIADSHDFDSLLERETPPTLEFQRLGFDDPAFIFFSSGTTGPPKCIVHGAGGILLQLLKEHVLHYDVKPGDRFFYYTTTGWNMWYWLATALAAQATVVLYEGSPLHPNKDVLLDLAEAEGVTHFGVSPRYLAALQQAGLEPMRSHDLGALRAVLSTGSPLAPEQFDYVYRAIKRDVCLSSISGGTEIMACFATGNPAAPVWRGELQAPALGMRPEVFDESGKTLTDGKGELVCTQTFPSLPVGFWGDPSRQRYRASYFERYPGVWHHGDFAEFTEHGGMRIHGRSDATLKPGGVRIGTAEIYRPVNQLEEVEDSLVIGQAWRGDVRIVLFVKLRDDMRLSSELVERIQGEVRRAATPRHVPSKVLQVREIPYTRTGKIAEIAVREVVHQRPVRNRAALANPASLGQYTDRRELEI